MSRKPYGDKATENDIIEACAELCDRINSARNSGQYLNIRYENFGHLFKTLRNDDIAGWHHEYRRLYKKARRLKINTAGVFREEQK